MSSIFEIPLISAPQKFSISLSGVTYDMAVKWCGSGQFWTLDVSDSSAVPIVQGIPLLPGVDLLSQYEYLGLGGQLVVQSDYDANAAPTSTDLGTNSHLYYVTP